MALTSACGGGRDVSTGVNTGVIDAGAARDVGVGPIDTGTDESVLTDDSPVTSIADANCPCVPRDASDTTLSLDCFCRFICAKDYDEFLRNPCASVRTFPYPYHGTVWASKYETCNFLGIEVDAIDSPARSFFFDTLTKEFVGAQVDGVWNDYLQCEQGPGDLYVIRAGSTPACPATETVQLCPPDGGSDAATPDSR